MPALGTSLLWPVELINIHNFSVILVTLYADSLHAILPDYSANAYKVWGLLL